MLQVQSGEVWSDGGHTEFVADRWSELAPWYDELVMSGSASHTAALSLMNELLPDFVEPEVLDVACGQGLATRALAEAGAKATGTDVAPGMLEIARRRSPTLEFIEDDAQRLGAFEDVSFDGLTCQLGLMDIPDLGAAVRSMHRVLRPNGWCVLVIGHPAFLAPGGQETVGDDGLRGRLIVRYLREEFWRTDNPNGVRGRAGNYHRPLSTYLNTLIRAGFRLDATSEAATPGSEVPAFFGARLRRS